MTETRGRRLAALAIVPVSASVFGAGLAWAEANDPTAAAPQATATPMIVPTEQIVANKLAAAHMQVLQIRVDEATARIGELQAVVDERSAAAAAEQQAAEAAAQAAAQAAARTSSSSSSSGSSSRSAPAPAPAPAPPPTNTSTGGSG